MALNLLDDRKFNDYLIDITYQGESVPKQQSYSGEFESADYVEQHRDEIVKGILNQYIKLRLRQYLVNNQEILEREPAFVLVDKNRTDLPGWTAQTFERGENIYEFFGAKMSQELIDKITMVRDFLYDEAGQYVDKIITRARETEKKPRIRYDYLKTNNEYDPFEKALAAAIHWHENIAEEMAKRNKSVDLYNKSLVGVRHFMDLSGNMSVYELLTPEALDFESEYMGHCVGKGAYDSGVKTGAVKIYSIRDEMGEPHVTLEVRDGKVYQCKGKSNKKPVKKYIPFIQDFILNNNLDIENDIKNTGFVKIDGILYDVYNLPETKEVKGDLDLSEYELEELPDLTRWIIHGSFNCNRNNLISLKGAPQQVDKYFDCSENKLIDLTGAPKSVGKIFDCAFNQLETLNGAPLQVGGDFDCSGNKLTDLIGAPKSVGGMFECSDNQITSLVGISEQIGYGFDCSNNKLTSLEGVPQILKGDFNCSGNQITSLIGVPFEIKGEFDCSGNRLTSLEYCPRRIVGAFKCNNNRIVSLNYGPEYVGGNYDCSNNNLTSLIGLPNNLEFGLNCSSNQITSLQGCQPRINGSFNCSFNRLTSLEFCPQYVGGDFKCSKNEIISLNYGPEYVGANYDCSMNKLTDLTGAPRMIGEESKPVSRKFDCSFNQLTTLVGAPEMVCGDFDCNNNRLTDLWGAPLKVRGSFSCSDNNIISLNGAPEFIGDYLMYTNNPIDRVGTDGTKCELVCGKIRESEGKPEAFLKGIQNIYALQAQKANITPNPDREH